MRDVVEARALIARSGAALGLRESLIGRIFEGTPIDFPVIIAERLPFFVHRAGMIGITLFGRVYLHARAQAYSPSSLLLLLRHEAEHVAQQRRQGLLFYPRYLFAWLRLFIAELFAPSKSRRHAGSAWHRAYRLIPAELEAYGAEARARLLLEEFARRESV